MCISKLGEQARQLPKANALYAVLGRLLPQVTISICNHLSYCSVVCLLSAKMYPTATLEQDHLLQSQYADFSVGVALVQQGIEAS